MIAQSTRRGAPLLALKSTKQNAVVMPALVAGIHAFMQNLGKARRGWPGQARP
jgi:hypothetical protein